MRIVVGLGGNALLHRGERADAAVQEANTTRAAGRLARLARAHQVVVTHGNGPQVGMLALESEADHDLARPYPLDVLVAETQGMIGYWLARTLRDLLPGREVAAMLTQVRVDRSDPAFVRPTKFIGRGYSSERARQLSADRGWVVRRDGRFWRRVVASPEPRGIVEIATLRRLVESGTVLVAGGGGGVPVARDPSGGLRGVEAVVDKDLTAALIAKELDADALLLLCDVPAVMRDFGTPQAAPIREATAAQLDCLRLPAGSMAPKVEACRRFAAAGGFAAIGSLDEAAGVLEGQSGTRILPDR